MRIHIEDLSPAAPGGALPEASRVSRAEAEQAIARWLQSSFMRAELLALCGWLGRGGGFGGGFGSAVSNADLEMRLLGALRSGDLELIRRPPGGEGGGGAPAAKEEKEEAPPEKSSPPPEPKTWIEFQVLDEEDQPIGGVRYRVKLPNGSTREGTTRPSGLIRFDDLDDGECEITLPELDGKTWDMP